MRIATRIALSVCVYCIVCAAVVHAQSNWPRFGGEAGDFTSSEKGIPQTWADGDLQWRVDLGGVGQSVPVIWDNHIFLTSSEQLSDGKVARFVHCLNRDDGKTIWKQQAATGPGEPLHKMNTWATPSCATDGKIVFA